MLTDTAIRNAKPRQKPYKLYDERGLFMLVTPAGGKLWRCKYHLGKKERLASFGPYPDVTLKFARQRRDDLRRKVAEGKDPAEKPATFKAVAERYLASKAPQRCDAYIDYSTRRLKELFEELGDKPLESIEPPQILKVLRKIEGRKAYSMAGKARVLAGQIFRYGIGEGLCVRNPAADLQDSLTPVPPDHHPAISPVELPALMRAIRGYDGEPVVRLGLQLLAHTWLRTTELIGASWDEIDTASKVWTSELAGGEEIDPESKVWIVPANRMKMKRVHLVPLSKQALAIIEQLRALNGSTPFIFATPNAPRRKPISNNTLLYALYRLGYHSKMTGHGFRAVASTIVNEAREAKIHRFSSDVIEFQLAHVSLNKVRSAYNRAEYFLPRQKMMQWYSDYLEKISA